MMTASQDVKILTVASCSFHAGPRRPRASRAISSAGSARRRRRTGCMWYPRFWRGPSQTVQRGLADRPRRPPASASPQGPYLRLRYPRARVRTRLGVRGARHRDRRRPCSGGPDDLHGPRIPRSRPLAVTPGHRDRAGAELLRPSHGSRGRRRAHRAGARARLRDRHRHRHRQLPGTALRRALLRRRCLWPHPS